MSKWLISGASMMELIGRREDLARAVHALTPGAFFSRQHW